LSGLTVTVNSKDVSLAKKSTLTLMFNGVKAFTTIRWCGREDSTADPQKCCKH
jgi:hypothetical protein